MYLNHFGLREFPFALTPDTSYYFNAASHREAMNVLLVALNTGEGFIKVTGEVGFGKSTLCRKLLNSLGDRFVTAYIPNPHLTPESIRRAVALEFGVQVADEASQDEVMRAITDRLIAHARAGKRSVLCLDEAQQLPDETLETVRLLTNLETEKRKLLQVVLFGQPELDTRLDQPHLRQLRQRITFSHGLSPFDARTVRLYVDHRLKIAGFKGAPLLDAAALDLVHRASRGTPRLVNVLCHKALLVAYGKGLRQVGVEHVRRAVEDTEDTRPRGWFGLRAALAASCGALALAAGWFLLVAH